MVPLQNYFFQMEQPPQKKIKEQTENYSTTFNNKTWSKECEFF